MKVIWESPPRHRFGPVVVVNLHLQKRSHHVSCLGCFMAWGRGVCNMLYWLLQPIATARNRLPWIAGVIFSWLACFNFVPPTPTEQQTCIFFPPTVVIENSNRLPKSFHCRQLPWNVLTTNCFRLHFFSFFFSVVTAWTSIPLSWLWCGVPVCVSVKVTIRLELEQDTPLMENLIHQTLFFLMPDFSGAVSHVWVSKKQISRTADLAVCLQPLSILPMLCWAFHMLVRRQCQGTTILSTVSICL